MPLASLKALAKHHADLQQHLPADDAEEAVRRAGLVAAILPRFAMACITEEEAAAAAKRREELEAIKKEREKWEAEEAKEAEEAEEAEEAREQQNAAPGQPGQPRAEEKRGASDDSGVLV